MDPILLTLVWAVVALIIAGLLLWAAGQLPLDATIARIIRVVVIVAVVFYLLALALRLAGVGWPSG